MKLAIASPLMSKSISTLIFKDFPINAAKNKENKGSNARVC